LEFAAPFGDSVHIQARDRGQTAVAAVTQFLGLQAHVESPLAFIEGTQEEVHLSVQRFDGIGIGPFALGTVTWMDGFVLHKRSPHGE